MYMFIKIHPALCSVKGPCGYVWRMDRRDLQGRDKSTCPERARGAVGEGSKGVDWDMMFKISFIEIEEQW